MPLVTRIQNVLRWSLNLDAWRSLIMQPLKASQRRLDGPLKEETVLHLSKWSPSILSCL